MLKRRYYKRYRLRYCCLMVLFYSVFSTVQAQQAPSILYEDEGRLTYISDPEGNRIPDFSHSGYRGGGVPLPYPSAKIILSPQAGDDTQRIQNALKSVGKMPRDVNGHRGAVLLKPGIYEISGNLKIRWNGVILRGSGSGSDPATSTILKVSKEVQGTVLTVGNPDANWTEYEKNSLTHIISEFVPVGSRNFKVENAELFETGDNIIIRHNSSEKWLNAINGGDTASAPPWEPGYIEIYYNRVVTGKSGNTLSIDAPVFNHLDRNLAETRVYKPKSNHVVSEVGVEYLQIVISSSHPTDDTHAENAIMFEGVENGWVRHVAVFHFQNTGVGTRNAKNITIRNTKALEPHSKLTGERRYNFTSSHFSNNILFDRVTSSNARRSFVSNGTSVASGIVFLNSRSIGALNSSEGHQKWSQALLFDNITFENPQTYFVLGLYNRGDIGSSHGWGTVHSVAWNVDAGGQYIFIQKPPTAQNYGIGNKGHVNGDGLFDHPAGFIEGTGTDPLPKSLYIAQLEERLKYGVPPDAPARLTVSNSNKNQLNLHWLHSSVKDTGFIIERSEDGGHTFSQIAVVQDSDSSYTDKTVAEYLYYYRVRAEDANGQSASSNVSTGKPVITNAHIGDFHLRLPQDLSEFSLDTDPDECVVFNWKKPETPLEMEYTWMMDRADGDFSSPIAAMAAGRKNEIAISYREIINFLIDASIVFDSHLQVKWTVKANSKTVGKTALDVYSITFVKKEGSEILNDPETDKKTELSQNFPNPFNPVTTIRFYLREESDVSLEVFDLAGTRVAIIVNGSKERGYHAVTFDARNLASGIYMYRLKTKNLEATRKMTLIK